MPFSVYFGVFQIHWIYSAIFSRSPCIIWHKVSKAVRNSHFYVWMDFEKGFVSVQKRVNAAGLKSLSLEGPACIWGLGFGCVPTLPHPIRMGLLCLDCLCEQCGLC